MKIDPHLQAVLLRPGSAQGRTPAPAADPAADFASLLKTTAASGRNQISIPALSSLDSTALLGQADQLAGQIQTLQAAAPSGTSPLAASQDIEQLLDLLDNYSQALADPAKSLKDLAPLADDLGLLAAELGQTSSKLGPNDPLKALSSDTATVAAVEALKFKRGDYI
ncbi:MAG: hypothetical protein LBK52_07545 [Deltaproteobacteria bacterium]|jgi:hypothetical protein|nr:hypothetical protein [Deltaproteobacteria bacterium]